MLRICQAAQANRTSQSLSKSIAAPTLKNEKKIKHENTTMCIVHSILRDATTPYTKPLPAIVHNKYQLKDKLLLNNSIMTSKSSSLIIFTFFISILLVSCSNNNRLTYEINSTGDTLSKTEYLNDGIIEVSYNVNRESNYYGDEIITFKDSLIHGLSKTFHSNDKIKSIVEFKNGRIWNVKTYQDSSGNKLDYGYINNGNGRLKIYWEDISMLKEEGDVINGFKEGHWYSYCGDGISICDSTLFTKGRNEFMKEWEEYGNPFFQVYN